MEMVSGHGHPIGALYRHHYLNCDVTGSAKWPQEVEIICMDVAICRILCFQFLYKILCNGTVIIIQ